MHRADNPQRVFGPVQKIRVPERDVRCPGGNLLTNVGQHYVVRHNKEPPAVNRRNRTMRAEKQMKTDYDIWKETMHIINSLKSRHNLDWVGVDFF